MAAAGINNELRRKKNRKKRVRAKYLEKVFSFLWKFKTCQD
jgi:hypothetical protein